MMYKDDAGRSCGLSWVQNSAGVVLRFDLMFERWNIELEEQRDRKLELIDA